MRVEARDDVVKTLFRKMSVKQLAGIEELDFTGIAKPTVEDAEQLGRCCTVYVLPRHRRIEKLCGRFRW